MANRIVTLVWLCKTPTGWKRFPVITAKNGRIRTGFVRISGVETYYPEGRFQVRYFLGTKTKYENAGNDPVAAIAQRDRLTRRKDIVNRAKGEGIEVKLEEGRLTFRKGVEKFLDRCEKKGKEEAVKSYSVALGEFMRFVPQVQYIDQVDEDAMLDFHAALRKQGNEDRTVANKHRAVMGMLRYLKVDVKSLAIEKPTWEKKQPRVYSEKQMTDLIAAAASNPYMSMVIDLLRMSGLRDGEGVHLEWVDIDYNRKLIYVRSKLHYGHKIKDREERDVPLPDRLAERLKAWQLSNGSGKLVLGNKEDQPEYKWLRKLKNVVRKAGLNCGHCSTCINRKECEKYTLHAFRRYYATTLHRKGIDARTLMSFTGHSDLETLLLYLAPMEVEEAHDQVHAAFA